MGGQTTRQPETYIDRHARMPIARDILTDGDTYKMYSDMR